MTPTAPQDKTTPKRIIGIVVALMAAILIAAGLERDSALEADEPDVSGPSMMTMLEIDLQGRQAMYGGGLLAGLGASAASSEAFDPPDAASLLPERQSRDPEAALRLAAFELMADEPEPAEKWLRDCDPDSSIPLTALADGLAEDADEEALESALDATTRLKPLWVRRAFRLHLLECQGDGDALAVEETVVASEAPERLLGPLVIMIGGTVAFGLGSLLWLIGIPAGLVWWSRQREQAAVSERAQPYAVAVEPARAEAEPEPAREIDAPAPEPGPSLTTAGEMLVAFFATELIVGAVLGRFDVPEGLFAYVVMVVYSLAATMAFLVARIRLGPGALKLIGFRRCPVWTWYALPSAAVVAMVPVYVVLSLVMSKLMDGTPESTNPALDVMVSQTGWLGRIVMVLTVSCLAPLAEEGMFRGALYSALKSKWGIACAIIVSSVLFGLVHMDFTMTPMLVLVGVTAAALRQVTDSVWPAVVLHCIFNGAMAMMLFLLTV